MLVELEPGLGIVTGPGIKCAAEAAARGSADPECGGGGGGDAPLVLYAESCGGETTAGRPFVRLEPGLGNAAGPGKKRAAGAAAGGPRCGDDGGGDAASMRAVRSRGEREATGLVFAP